MYWEVVNPAPPTETQILNVCVLDKVLHTTIELIIVEVAEGTVYKVVADVPGLDCPRTLYVVGILSSH
jgi:hypothetical protein